MGDLLQHLRDCRRNSQFSEDLVTRAKSLRITARDGSIRDQAGQVGAVNAFVRAVQLPEIGKAGFIIRAVGFVGSCRL